MERTETLENEFKAPTCAADFKVVKQRPVQGEEGETKFEDYEETLEKIEHTYPNGNKVVFVLLGNGQVACIREGSGTDVEAATMESQGNSAKYLSAMIAATTKIDGRQVNMFELAALKMKDYVKIKATFAELNF